MSEDALASMLAAHTDGERIGTHWDNCYQDPHHPGCAVYALVAEVRRLQKQLQQMAAAAVTAVGEWQELGSWLKANGHEEVLAHLRRVP